jgi:uroporphyrinogen-III synthase
LKTDPAPPLRGRVVAITRPERQSRGIAELVESLGGVPQLAPTVEIRPPEDRGRVEEFIRGVARGELDLLIFLSVNSVGSLFRVADDAGLSDDLSKSLEDVTVVAIGGKTLDALKRYGVEVKIVPDDQSSRGVLESLDKTDLEGLPIGMPRSSKADGALKRVLEAKGAAVREVTAYESGLPSDITPALGLIKALGRGDVDAVTFTSASTGRNLFEIANAHGLTAELEEGLRGTAIAAIGPATGEALKELGVRVDVLPGEHSTEALIGALVENLNLEKGERNAERTRGPP